MAKIHEEVIIIKLSKLTKDSEKDIAAIASGELINNLEVLVQELTGPDVIVEVEQA